MSRIRLMVAAVLALVVAMAVMPAGVAAAACEEPPTHAGEVTPPEQAAPGFPQRRILTAEINRYLGTVDDQSDRVTAGTYGTSVAGTDLTYALVSTPDNLARVDEIAAANKRLRDPRGLTQDEARALAESTPAIVWYTGNVHGSETSGADAAVSLLHDLADRTDCTVATMLDDLVIGIMPTQNPDGRDFASRQNRYAFDLNRDWFARTQPETDTRLDLLAQYPPVLFIDAHEMGSSDFFFPPNADPIHHEISHQSLDQINNTYGTAIAEAFDERQGTQPGQWEYFNYNVYDLFYMGYGDTVPTTAFGAAGMTFEKGTADPDGQKHDEQYVAGWVSLTQAAQAKDRILFDLWVQGSEAIADGAAGRLEPNLVVEPHNEVQFAVPDLNVRHYFLRTDRGAADAARIVDRLVRTNVEVYALDAPLEVPDLEAYGREPATTTLPAGTYWIPMDQPQKRWIQGLLGEDPYTPFPYFYDVTSWSNPLLANVDAAFSGATLEPDASRVTSVGLSITGDPQTATMAWFAGDSGQAVAAALNLAQSGAAVARLPQAATIAGQAAAAGTFVVEVDGAAGVEALTDTVGRFPLPVHVAAADVPEAAFAVDVPKIAMFSPVETQLPVVTSEAYGHQKWLLERSWQLPFDELTGAQIAAGQLESGDYDVLVVPAVSTAQLQPATEQVRSWIDAGGTYVGTARSGGTGGTGFAVSAGFTTATTSPLSGAQVGGTAFRMAVTDATTPVTLGAGDEAFFFNLGERVLTSGDSSRTPVSYATGDDFWFSGYGVGVEPLEGTAGIVEESLGDGAVVLFSGEPNFRGYTEGVSFFLANALASPSARSTLAGPAADVSDAAFAAQVAAARRTGDGVGTGPGRPISLEVAQTDLPGARTLLGEFTTDIAVEWTPRGTAILRIPNPQGLDMEAHPFVYQLRPAFEDAGIELVSALF